MKRFEKIKNIKPKQTENVNNPTIQPNEIVIVENANVLDLSHLNGNDLLNKLFDNISNPNITSIVIDNSKNNQMMRNNDIMPYEAVQVLGNIAMIVLNSKNIKSLTIKLTNEMGEDYTNFIKTLNKCENLESLTLSNINVTTLLDKIQIPNLKALEISDHQLGDYSPIQLLCFNHKKLESFTLGGFVSQQKAKLLKNLFPEIKLTCDILDSHLIITEGGELNLCEGFKDFKKIKLNATNPKISSIVMNNKHGMEGENLVFAVTNSMKTGNYKNVQSIRFNDIHGLDCNSSTIEFFDEVGQHNSIKELTLGKCMLKPSEIQILNSKSLVKFDCWGNGMFGDYSTFKVLSLQNPNLKFLNWSHNNVDNIESVTKIMCERNEEKNPICITLLPEQFGAQGNGGNTIGNPYNDIYVPLYLSNVGNCFKSVYYAMHENEILTFLLCTKEIQKSMEFKIPKVITKGKIIDEFVIGNEIEEFLANDPVFLHFEQNLSGDSNCGDINQGVLSQNF